MSESSSAEITDWGPYSRFVLAELNRLDRSMTEQAAHTTEALEKVVEDLRRLHEDFLVYKAECRGREEERERRMKGPQMVSYILGVIQLVWIVVYAVNQLGAP